MKVVCISDTHSLHDCIVLPKGDMIIHAGDISASGLENQVMSFLNWFSKLNYTYKIFIAGNHDFLFERSPQAARNMIPDNVIYLEESGIIIEGLRLWGTPITPYFNDWAFNRLPGKDIEKHTQMIPENLDILISHGPPHGILDKNVRGKHCGCVSLRSQIEKTNPRVVIMGHVHEGYGQMEHDGIHFINASLLNEHYRYTNDPVVWEIH